MSAPDRCLPLALLVVLGSGCATTSAPPGWLPPAEGVGQEAFGGWIEATTGAGVVEGELVAVGADSLFVLSPDGNMRILPKTEVARAQVAYAESRWKTLSTWGAVGSVATISHGAFLIASFPAWLAISAETARVEAKGHMRHYPRHDWDAFVPYARFPQGWPEGLDRRALRPR